MLYHLLYPLHTEFSVFYVFRFITFRTIYAAITALVISFLLGPWLIEKLSALQMGQSIRKLGPESHFKKEGTPTMGGALILVSVAVSTLLWSDLSNDKVWVALTVTLLFGLIGGVDDYKKLVYGSSKGLSAKSKYFWQTVFGLGAAVVMYRMAESPIETTLIFPFVKDVMIPLGGWFIVMSYFVIVGSSNAVNLTDGLDGLAAGSASIVLGTFCFIAFLEWTILDVSYGIDVAVIGASALAACIGFLWWNTAPAEIFMGDTGSQTLGFVLGVMADSSCAAVSLKSPSAVAWAITGTPSASSTISG